MIKFVANEFIFSARNGQIYMEMTFTNRAMQPMSDFAIQFNKNSFGLTAGQPLQVQSPLLPNQSYEAALLLNPTGPVQKMDPINNIQVNANSVVFFCVSVVLHSSFIRFFCCDCRSQ